MLKFTFVILLIFSHSAFADLKEDFMNKVVAECGLSKDEAEALATPGRTGNILKLKLCPQSPVVISENCKLTCSTSSGNVVGN